MEQSDYCRVRIERVANPKPKTANELADVHSKQVRTRMRQLGIASVNGRYTAVAS